MKIECTGEELTLDENTKESLSRIFLKILRNQRNEETKKTEDVRVSESLQS